MRRRAATTLGLALAICAFVPATASAGLLDTLCGVAGTIGPGVAGKACNVATHVGKVVGIVKKVVGVGQKLSSGNAGGTSKAAPALGLAGIVTWVLGGAAFALHETAKLLGKTTDPELGTAWFSTTYLHMAAIATLLTLPFLFAAVVQALMRSDLAMLARAAFAYLPLAMLAIFIAVRVTTLLLAAADSLSGVIEQAAGGQATHFLVKASLILGALTALTHSPFVAFLIGFFVAAGALALWLELVLREVAVYVIVLTLPLVFAALVWPARRTWAIRAVELLMALILAKLAIVAVLALGAGALQHAAGSFSIVSLLAGIALVTLGAFAPWALVKLMPVAELAAAAAGPLHGQFRAAGESGAKMASPWADAGAEHVVADMRRMAMAAEPAFEGADSAAAPGSREGDVSTEGVQGVTGGEDPDPLRGTADPPAGPSPSPAPGGPSSSPAPGGPATPHGPAAPGAASAGATDPPDRGPAPTFQSFEGAEAFWHHDGDSPPPPLTLGDKSPYPSPPADDDPTPPAQEPEDGRL
jgi:hypothetical protein